MSAESEELKKAGLKVTGPRMKILALLESHRDGHLSAEEIYKRLGDSGEDVGIATVYRVLTQFEGAGLITRHNFEGGHAVFELASEEHHDHMVCTKTGAVIEFVDPVIEERQHLIAEQHGYELVGHNLTLYVRPKKSS